MELFVEWEGLGGMVAGISERVMCEVFPVLSFCTLKLQYSSFMMEDSTVNGQNCNYTSN